MAGAMMIAYSFRIDGPPMGKPAIAQDRHGRRYRRSEVTQYYARIAWRARGADGFDLAQAPAVVITAIKARPKRRPRDYPLPWQSGRNPCLAKPDADNIAKIVLDGLVLAGAFRDDAAVSALTVITMYAATNEAPHVAVAIRGRRDVARHRADASSRARR